MPKLRTQTTMTGLLSALALILTAQASRADLITPSDFMNSLRGQLSHLNRVIEDTERLDMPQVLSIKATTQSALESIESNGLGHIEDIQALQSLVITHKFADNLLDRITTDRSRASITRIKYLSQDLTRSTGLDRSVFSKITATVFRQMVYMLQNLPKESQIAAKTQAELRSLIAPMGILIGVATLGDNLKTLREGEKMYHRVQKLYPQLDEIALTDAAFTPVMTIQGLNNYYGKVIRAQGEGQL